MRIIGRSGFEVETLAFYLSTLGMSVAASSTPDDMLKQVLLTWRPWLCSCSSDAVLGARNWLEFGGFSFQPSELVKVAYVYVGAATLDRLYRRRNLYSFIAFSAFCVVSLALIGDFGTALIFFVTFLVISFMRSGSIATVFLAVTGAGMAGFLAVSVKPYIAQRFASWGHVWEDMYNTGYQQTRAMSAAAAGGLFGKGAGAGWLKDIFAANTDMVFAMICEELGLIIALCMVAAVLVLAFFAVRSARNGRSAYYAIAACATMSMLLTQMALNVFGSLDLLPFTGVTFPFVSRGGSSLLSCWMLMAFIKGADNRRDASFAVRPGERMPRPDEERKGGGGMKKITNRPSRCCCWPRWSSWACSVYVIRYVDHGRDWALSFSRAQLRLHRRSCWTATAWCWPPSPPRRTALPRTRSPHRQLPRHRGLLGPHRHRDPLDLLERSAGLLPAHRHHPSAQTRSCS